MMTFLKWYTFIYILLSFFITLYSDAEEKKLFNFILSLLLIPPMLVYVFLS